MKPRPLPNEAERRLRGNVPNDHVAVEIELAVLTLMLRMEMRRLMLPVEHADNDPEEDSDNWHTVEYTS